MNRFNYDTHMHLDLYKNIDDLIKYIEENKSYTIAVTNLPVLYEKYIQEYKNLKYIRFAVGLHPQLIGQYKNQIPKLIKDLKYSKYIGEIGLDFNEEDVENKALQINTFKEIIDNCNKLGGKILSIHSRKASKHVIEIIGDKFNGKIILHWFSGTISELREAIENGYYFSINTEMVKSKKGIELIKNIPIERILIESDAPFTRSTKDGYNLNFISDIEKGLIKIKGLEGTNINEILKNNFKKLLNV
ncbi:TatD family hydrolase [Clostridium sp. 19966]|uniref:Tat-linked quality control protein TatD n=1 Tax=Clostridium butyricum TaxID=1492 RepID=A0A6N2ZVL6_CLOBU|nr:Qat anti-phage system TatD family nuclease QatD [Clostridium sp. 19966]MDT8717020.1 TatD family hydrolase [Clostridium sp. 19966]